MKKIISFLIALTVILSFYYLYYMQPKKYITKLNNVLIVGTSPDYPPYEKIDLATGRIVGFDIDLVQEIGRRLGKEIQLKDMPFNSLMLNLAAGQVDLVAAGLSISQERKEAVLFSNVYLDNDYMVIVSKKSTLPLTSVKQLFGKSVAVNTGYNADTYLSTMPEISLVRLDSAADSALALQADSVYAFATSKSSYNIFMEQQGNPDNYQYFEIPNTAENCAFALEKNNTKLQEEINLVLHQIKEDGTLQKIKKAWGF